jgi:hypothetical protein
MEPIRLDTLKKGIGDPPARTPPPAPLREPTQPSQTPPPQPSSR